MLLVLLVLIRWSTRMTHISHAVAFLLFIASLIPGIFCIALVCCAPSDDPRDGGRSVLGAGVEEVQRLLGAELAEVAGVPVQPPPRELQRRDRGEHSV